MVYNKTKIYNLALSHLLLSRQVDEVETDTTSNEVQVLNTFWEEALNLTLQDLDLDSLSENVQLELLGTLDGDPWNFVYKYPSRCSFLRRIVSGQKVDTERTFIAKKVAMYSGKKAIFTNQADAYLEIIPNDLDLGVLNASAALAISYKLASLASPLIVGKGAKKLKDDLVVEYLYAKEQAQEIDRAENFNFECPSTRSTFVAARME